MGFALSVALALLPAAGAGDDTGAAARAGVTWLVRHQQEDGSWRGAREGAADIGTTALAVLALDRAGADSAAAREARARALEWLMRKQDAETGLIGRRKGHDFHYGHAIAAQALCRAADDGERVRAAAVRSVEYILEARNPYAVWRYDNPPAGDNDTSVTGWMIGALRAAEEAGLAVDRAVYADCLRWLDAVTDTETGRVGYDAMGSTSSRVPLVNDHFPPESGEAMTAIGLTLRAKLGQSRDRTPILDRHTALMQRRLPVWDPEGFGSDLYYWYYGTEALSLVGGETWDAWRGALTEALVGSQRAEGDDAGSWDPVGPWCYAGGRAYSTALMTSCLAMCAE